ncbi:hypothetical protein [Pantoea cypripedii]|uniref:Uncharacterized protein n=1 Tax=Pantoea cypripedii TaxID=55209 RepID=A0A1X1EMJ1_PANCY|nr:hypothetical protein [Pantoea cypripedii]MBP2200600.1 hypothetical protein [Pantoea cypripedii]ORM90096.1 hypothetical protein HA50_26355 [Pantoea cypripedii]
MLQNHGAVRTLIAWFTLFFAWSASVLWFHGVMLMKFMMSNSSLFAYDLALRSTGTLLPDGIPLLLLTFMVLAAGAVLATGSLAAVSLLRPSRRQAAHFSRAA